MPGKTKRKYQGESMRVNKKLKRPLMFVQKVLPKEYDINIIINEFKKYYPYEWKELNERYYLYKNKDKFLVKQGKPARYKPLPAKEYLLNLPQVKNLLSAKCKELHRKNFDEEIQLNNIRELETKRRGKINITKEKLKNNTKNLQEIEPLYIEAFIAAYHQHGITIDGKVEIFNELIKYNTNKTIEFFYKLNDAERNDQIRNMAFKHLQSLGRYVKLRGKFEGKKKSYIIEKSDFNMTPKDLWQRIESDTIQNRKIYDVFLSHSSTDSGSVLKTIKCLNRIGLNVYCDWTSDNDFLKRNLVSDYTRMVLKKRLEQSKNLLLLVSKNSIASEWVKFELDTFSQFNKPIYYINLEATNFNRMEFYKELEYDFNKNYIQKLE